MAQADLVSTVADFYACKACLKPGESVLLAVSGGPDSVALLHASVEVAPALGIGLAVAHFDHRLRPESRADALFVRRLAGRLSLPFHEDSADVAQIARRSKASVEEAARIARYEFLESVRTRSQCRFIATGHNLEDQAETVLLRLIRGAGAVGLAAMRPIAGAVIRPLLNVPRATIRQFCRRRKIQYLNDSTNLEPVADRNRLRLAVMPELRRIRPGVEVVLARAADLFALEGQTIEWAAQAALELAQTHVAPGRVELSRDELRELPEAVALLALRRAAQVAGRSHPPPLGRLREVLSLAVATGGRGRKSLGSGFEVLRGARTLLLYRTGDPHPAIKDETLVPLGEATIIPGLERRIMGEVIDDRHSVESLKSQLSRQSRATAHLDFESVNLPLVVRGIRQDDTFVPFGHTRRVSVRRFIASRAVPTWARDSIPIVAAAAAVVWVGGLELDDRYRVRTNTRTILRLTLEDEGGAATARHALCGGMGY